MPGWCTHALDFSRYPDVEFFCGGVNSQTPTSAALWRQGNLLHFGFEESPSQMNESGRNLLLNSIVYISRFTEDRPIAITPSPFAGPFTRARSTVARWLRNPEFRVDHIQDLVSADVWKKLSAEKDREVMAAWADANAKFLHPDADHRLAFDEDLVVLGAAFDRPEFFEKALKGLRSQDEAVLLRSRRLLKRYVPDGPEGDSADIWQKWWGENEPFAFASDAGDYRWYVDPLAKKRGVPSKDLRGPKRADVK
jgi:hypothetical protein